MLLPPEGVPTGTALAVWHRAQCHQHLALLACTEQLPVLSPKPVHGRVTPRLHQCRSHSDPTVPPEREEGEPLNPRWGVGRSSGVEQQVGVIDWSRQEPALGWTPRMDMEWRASGRDPQTWEDAERWLRRGKRGVPPPKKKHRER